MTATAHLDTALQHFDGGWKDAVATLERLVRIPSISLPNFAAGELVRAADEVAAVLAEAGADTVEVWQADGGHPTVFAESAGERSSTVLLYAHYDVQPAGDKSQWLSPPFDPQHRDGRLYGRGTADDKAAIVMHACALRCLDDEAPTLKVIVEGEEEIGSPNLGTFLDRHADRLRADVVVVPDCANWSLGVPALTTSLRGLISCYVELRTLAQPIHSGLYGGAVPDALSALARLLSSLHDNDGEVAVDGLVSADGAVTVDLNEVELRKSAGMLDGVRLIGREPLTRRLWHKPAATVLGIDAPAAAGAPAQLLPRATAKVALRLAPGDSPEHAMACLAEHLQAHAPWGAQVAVKPLEYVQPFACRRGRAADVAMQAMREAWGAEPVEVGVGGSIAFLSPLAQAMPEAEFLLTAVEDPAANIHAPNESVHLDELRRAAEAEIRLLSYLRGWGSQDD